MNENWLHIIYSTIDFQISVYYYIIYINYIIYHCRSIVNLHTCYSYFSLFFSAVTFLIQTPPTILQIYFNVRQPTSLYCQISVCLGTFGTGVLAYSSIAQAISRFSITAHYKHKYLLTFRTNWIMINLSWLISASIVVGMFMSLYAYQYDPESHFRIIITHNFPTSIFISNLFVFISVLILIILYGIILRYTIYQTRINPNSESTVQARRNKRVFQNIIFTFSVYAAWPLYSIQVISLSFTGTFHSIFLFIINKQAEKRVDGRRFDKGLGKT
ncbi:hypothetical protein I4U23_022354 [Adineta vaga]|nr:hypothetical protein I4U23_022354 [Adineta vaga]